MYRMHIARISSRMLVSAPPPKQSFLLFCWPAREMGALPRPCPLALRVTAKQLFPLPYSRNVTSPDSWSVASLVFSAVFPRRVSGSADHFGADRTLDRAGAAQEWGARFSSFDK